MAANPSEISRPSVDRRVNIDFCAQDDPDRVLLIMDPANTLADYLRSIQRPQLKGRISSALANNHSKCVRPFVRWPASLLMVIIMIINGK